MEWKDVDGKRARKSPQQISTWDDSKLESTAQKYSDLGEAEMGAKSDSCLGTHPVEPCNSGQECWFYFHTQREPTPHLAACDKIRGKKLSQRAG